MKGTESFFSGNERIEMVDVLGRPMRKGAPGQLAVSDRQRITDAIDRDDGSTAMAYLDLMHPTYIAMNKTFIEWCVAMPACLAKDAAQLEKQITRDAYTLFGQSIADDGDKAGNPATAVMLEVLHPRRLTSTSIKTLRNLRAKHQPTDADAVLTYGLDCYDRARAAVQGGDRATARSAVQEYYRTMRVAHDLCGEYVSSYASVMLQHIGQKRTARVVQEGLAGCDMLKGYWKKIILKLDQEGLAAALAEHLRGHFSGPGREGSVTIVEDEEKIRLIMDPCGTGGALRRRGCKSLGTYASATPDTWGRADEVPSYCAHCAKNEQMLIAILGYPALVTQFDPDPDKPCGWTFYKHPADIPEHYYTRVGRRKPSPLHLRLRLALKSILGRFV
jgi:hypothetical protein